MRLSELKAVLGKQPFEPFRIRLSNGDEYVIRHPEFALLTKTSVYVGILSRQEGVPDHAVQVDLLHVVSTEPVNGTRRSTRKK